MTIQRLEEIPAVCLNPDCKDYQEFNLVDVDKVKDDALGGFIMCPCCKRRIAID